MPNGDPRKLVKTGDPFVIQAASHNRWQRAANFIEDGDFGIGAGKQVTRDPDGRVRIKNMGSTAVVRFGVLELVGIVFTQSDSDDQFKNHPTLLGQVPNIVDGTGTFAVVDEPIAIGKIGWARVSGITPVKISMVNASHQFADVKDSDATQLVSGPFGSAQILNVDSGTGTKWAIVRLGNKLVYPTSIPGLIVCNGPCGESDFTDNRYWVQLQKITNACSAAIEPLAYSNLPEKPSPCPGDACESTDVTLRPQIVVVTNLGENNARTHLAHPNTEVMVTVTPDEDGYPAYTTQYIDLTDNGFNCTSPSSTPSSEASSAPASSTATSATPPTSSTPTSSTPPVSSTPHSSTPPASSSPPSGPCPCSDLNTTYPTLSYTMVTAAGTHSGTMANLAFVGAPNEWADGTLTPSPQLQYNADACRFSFDYNGGTAIKITASCDPTGTYTVIVPGTSNILSVHIAP